MHTNIVIYFTVHIHIYIGYMAIHMATIKDIMAFWIYIYHFHCTSLVSHTKHIVYLCCVWPLLRLYIWLHVPLWAIISAVTSVSSGPGPGGDNPCPGGVSRGVVGLTGVRFSPNLTDNGGIILTCDTKIWALIKFSFLYSCAFCGKKFFNRHQSNQNIVYIGQLCMEIICVIVAPYEVSGVHWIQQRPSASASAAAAAVWDGTLCFL